MTFSIIIERLSRSHVLLQNRLFGGIVTGDLRVLCDSNIYGAHHFGVMKAV